MLPFGVVTLSLSNSLLSTNSLPTRWVRCIVGSFVPIKLTCLQIIDLNVSKPHYPESRLIH